MVDWFSIRSLSKLKILAIACASGMSLAITALYVDGARSSIHQADYAIVYGNKVHPNGIPSKRLQARLDKAIELFSHHQVSGIVVSGGVGKEGQDEAVVMAQYLQQYGVPQNMIIVDSQGNNSHLTALNAAHLIGPDSSVIAVSQLFHLSRAKLSLRNAGFQSVGSAYPLFLEARDLYSTMRELPAWLKYWLTDS